jgi:hypothetical protein
MQPFLPLPELVEEVEPIRHVELEALAALATSKLVAPRCDAAGDRAADRYLDRRQQVLPRYVGRVRRVRDQPAARATAGRHRSG